MEVQKHLFRIAQRANKNEISPLCWFIVYIFSTIICIILAVLIFIGEIYVKPNNHILENCLSSVEKLQSQHYIGVIYNNQLSLQQFTTNQTQLIRDTKKCQIYKNLNNSTLQGWEKTQFTFTSGLLFFDSRKREEMKFDNYTFVFKQASPITSLAYGLENLIAMELLQMKNKQGQYLGVKGSKTTFLWLGQAEKTIQQKIYCLFAAICSYGLSSIVTSIYIYVTIVCSPSVIILFLRCTRFGRNQNNILEVAKIFPWIGMHSLIRQAATNEEVKKNVDDVCKSLLCYFCVIYLVYYQIITSITISFFDMPSEEGVQETYFGYLAIIEFGALIFIRTRPFLRYFPVANSLSLILFLLYSKFSLYGFKLYAVFLAQFFGIGFFSWMMMRLEVPAQTTWNPAQHCVPTIEKPRIGLMPIFNLNWLSSLSEQWGLMIPLFGRNNFNERELAFVDRRYEQLNQGLNE